MLPFFQKFFIALFMMASLSTFGQIEDNEYYSRSIFILSSGISFSSFEAQKDIYSEPIKQNSLTSSIPISFSYYYNIVSNLFLGGNVELSMTPFKIEAVTGEEEIWIWNNGVRNNIIYNDIKSIREISQTMISLNTLYMFGRKTIMPYIGGGIGIYFGSITQYDYNNMGYEQSDFKTNIGFQLSGGLIYKIDNFGISLSLNYNIISHTLDKDEFVYTEIERILDPSTARTTKIISVGGLPSGKESISYNNYGIKLGLIIFFQELFTKL